MSFGGDHQASVLQDTCQLTSETARSVANSVSRHVRKLAHIGHEDFGATHGQRNGTVKVQQRHV